MTETDFHLTDDLSQITSSIQRFIDNGCCYGSQLYVSRFGEPLLDWSGGLARPRQPMHPNTIVRWFCTVKPVIAIAILQCFEANAITLDDDVGKFIPALDLKRFKDLTLRSLLTHQGGLINGTLPIEKSLEDVIGMIQTEDPQPEVKIGNFPAYQLFKAWYLLAAVVEKVTSVDIASYVRTRIFEPCGMHRSWLSIPQSLVGDLSKEIALPCKYKRGKLRIELALDGQKEFSTPNPAFGGYGPMHDLARLFEAMLAPRQLAELGVLQERTLEMMCEPQRVGKRDLSLGYKCDYGLGVLVHLGDFNFGIPGPAAFSAFGHDSIEGRWVFADRRRRLVASLCLNGYPPECRPDPPVNPLPNPVIAEIYRCLKL